MGSPSRRATRRRRGPCRSSTPSLAVVYSGTDDDAQLLISTGSHVPFDSLSVIGPRGTPVISAHFDDGSRRLGQKDLRVETA